MSEVNCIGLFFDQCVAGGEQNGLDANFSCHSAQPSCPAFVRSLQPESCVDLGTSTIWATTESAEDARPVYELYQPLVSWSPSDEKPDFWELSRVLHRRANTAASMTTFVFASARSVAMFGRGRAPSVKLTQMTHDLQVAEVYLRYRTNGLSARHWVSEDRLPRDWPLKQRPDATVTNEEGEIHRAVEYGGDYPPSRLVEMHDGLSSIQMDYEIW